ncbi:cobalamin biosynthesis protein CobD [Rhodoferax lacus]|uniref:Cobalamin biosynthesis protein CobD n=1 Tax=Rhodoferax lacus TaxID=2184758 RepID=A0A3E1REB6_9BURK|nr:adenosylcobinamide-phosphate synthase CbiB [Rhodoferax lacus]RFO97571.1 cobalamin biosynthesis protein CobD [Rhodoferax lacus]
MSEWPALSALVALLLALAVDTWWGEPPVRLHPVVWMGRALGWAGQGLQRLASQRVDNTDYTACGLGALAWCALALVVLGMSCACVWMLQGLPWWCASLLLGLLLKPMLAWNMLKSEVQAVEHALGRSLATGRERLSWVVSRDVGQLSATQVRESAIESLAENLNDSVVAPIFWFVLLGLPGAAVYRFANTADAMWGYRGIYKGQNWEWAGKWAAWADDLLSWVPARITALLLLAARGGPGLALLARLGTEARHTPSPNSGWPMAAMALKLNVALCKPGVYTLNAPGRAVESGDVSAAIGYASRALRYLVAIVAIALIGTAVGACA